MSISPDTAVIATVMLIVTLVLWRWGAILFIQQSYSTTMERQYRERKAVQRQIREELEQRHTDEAIEALDAIGAEQHAIAVLRHEVEELQTPEPQLPDSIDRFLRGL